MWNRVGLSLFVVMSFSFSAHASKCNQKFLNTLTANIFKVGCDEKGDDALCERANDYDNRVSRKNRKLNVEPPMSVDVGRREIMMALGLLQTVAQRSNPYMIGLRAYFSGLGEYSPCNGERFYTDEVLNQKFDTDQWGKSPYVQRKGKPHACKADFHLEKDDALEKFFGLPSDQERLAALKDPAVCEYYSILNEKVIRPVVKKSFDQNSAAADGSKPTVFQKGSVFGRGRE